MALSKSEEEIPLTYFMWLKIDFSPLFSPRSILVFYPKSIPYNLIIEQHHVKKPVNLQALIFIYFVFYDDDALRVADSERAESDALVISMCLLIINKEISLYIPLWLITLW